MSISMMIVECDLSFLHQKNGYFLFLILFNKKVLVFDWNKKVYSLEHIH